MGYVGPMALRHLRKAMPSAYIAGYDSGFFAHCLTTAGEMPEILLDAQRFGDVRKIGAGDLEGFDAVVHLAAVSNDPMGNRFEAVTGTINHRGTGGQFLAVNVGSNAWNYQVKDLANAVAASVPAGCKSIDAAARGEDEVSYPCRRRGLGDGDACGTSVSINTAAPPDKRSYKVDFSLF
jgi:hypothetical protein